MAKPPMPLTQVLGLAAQHSNGAANCVAGKHDIGYRAYAAFVGGVLDAAAERDTTRLPGMAAHLTLRALYLDALAALSAACAHEQMSAGTAQVIADVLTRASARAQAAKDADAEIPAAFGLGQYLYSYRKDRLGAAEAYTGITALLQDKDVSRKLSPAARTMAQNAADNLRVMQAEPGAAKLLAGLAAFGGLSPAQYAEQVKVHVRGSPADVAALPPLTCRICGKPPRFSCAACKAELGGAAAPRYCGPECQKADWAARHKRECVGKKTGAQAAAAAGGGAAKK